MPSRVLSTDPATAMNMKTLRPALLMLSVAIGLLAHASYRPAHAQPIPVEAMAGSRYASVNVVMSKSFSASSKFGFFHLNTLTAEYNDKRESDLTLQDLLFFEPLEGFRITGGAFYASQPGFSPTAGMQFIHAGKRWFILLAPRVNIERDPSYTVFSILRYEAAITERATLYTSLQALNIFGAEGHIKSYQWTRIGLGIGGTQFGLAANFDEFGLDPQVAFSAGVFVRREVF